MSSSLLKSGSGTVCDASARPATSFGTYLIACSMQSFCAGNWMGPLYLHYRARVEHLIKELSRGRKTLNTKWRGSFSLLAAIMKIVAHMVGLEERMKGPRYDVFGPWPVCPANVAALYP